MNALLARALYQLRPSTTATTGGTVLEWGSTSIDQDTGTTFYPVTYDPPPMRGDEWVKVDRSRQALAEAVKRDRRKRPDPPAAVARCGFAQAARLPCYRGTRTR